MSSFSCALHALGALWSISSQISDKKADAFCKSLEKRSPELLETLRNLYDKHKERNMFDDRSFCRYVVDLIYLQTKKSLSDRLSADHLKEVCDERCRCCESWNDGVRSRAFEQATIEINKMLEAPSGNFELFHEFAQLAVQNEVERQEIRMSQSLRVATALPDAVALSVADASALPVAVAAALPTCTDEDDSVMYD
jgi:hypothetical protein